MEYQAFLQAKIILKTNENLPFITLMIGRLKYAFPVCGLDKYANE